MVAFMVSLAITLAMLALVVLVGLRRAPGTPLTWGEAFAAGVFVFTLMFMIYGVVPHQWLTWAGNELAWRSDSYGIPVPFRDQRLFEDGITFFGRGRVLVPLSAIQDGIATGIYIVGLVANVFLWSWWQKRGQRAREAPAQLTSAYGRPILKRV